MCREPGTEKSEKSCGDRITIVLKTISGVAVEVIHNPGFAVTEDIDFNPELDDKWPSLICGKERVREIGELNEESRGVLRAAVRHTSAIKAD